VRSGIALHYAAHALANDDEFADFHTAVLPPRGLRRWIRPTTAFHFESAPPFKPLPATQAYPLLEWGLNWCVATQCHQYLIIHAAVVERGDRALVLPAPPGSGKSTLCAGLVARGWRLLSDELALIDPETLEVVPLPRPISLKNNAIGVIEAFWSGAPMSPAVDDTLKGSVAHVQPPATSVRLSSRNARPGWVVLPRYDAGMATTLSPLSKGSAFMQLVDSAFNYSVHGRGGFDTLAEFVSASECFEFRYGGDLDEATQRFDALAGAG
jgi:HprK-related kinase A